MSKLSKKAVRQILKEELLVIKLNQQILKEHQELIQKRLDWNSLLVREYLKEELGYDLDPMLLDEGLWEKAKYIMGIMGSLEKGGKFFGRGKAAQDAGEKYGVLVQKLASQAITKNLIPSIKEAEPKFPNGESQKQFVVLLIEIGKIYDSVYDASLKPTGTEGALPCKAAHELIDNLRKVVRYYLDYKLSDVYKHFTEDQDKDPESSLDTLFVEQMDEATRMDEAEEEERQAQFTQRGAGEGAYEETESTTMKGLKSNLFPALLAAGGLVSILAGFLVGSEWFQELLLGPKAWTEKIKVITQTIGPDKPTGASQMLGNMLHGNASHFGPSTKAADFMTAATAPSTGGGTGLSAMASFSPNHRNFASIMQSQYNAGITKFGANATMDQVWPLSGVGADPAIQLTIPGKVVKTMGKIILKRMARTGAAAVAAGTMTAVGSGVLVPLGIGLIASGAAVKLIRMKGMKSSRAQLMKDLIEEMGDSPCEDEKLPPVTCKEPAVEKDGKCVCPEGFTYNEETKECVETPPEECVEPRTMVDGKCVCPEGGEWDEDTKTCVKKPEPIECEPGTVPDPEDPTKCIPEPKTLPPKIAIARPGIAVLDDDAVSVFRVRWRKKDKIDAQTDIYKQAQDAVIIGRNTDPESDQVADPSSESRPFPANTKSFKQIKRRAMSSKGDEPFFAIDGSIITDLGNKGKAKNTGLPRAGMGKANAINVVKSLFKLMLSKERKSTRSEAGKVLSKAGVTDKKQRALALKQLEAYGLVLPTKAKKKKPAAKEKPMAPMVDTVKDMEGDLPGSMKEGKTLDRWKVLAGIK